MEWGGVGGSKKSKPIPASSRGTGLQSPHIPILPPLRGRENPRRAKPGVKWSKVKLPSLGVLLLGGSLLLLPVIS